MSGRYASYWNAFLLHLSVSHSVHSSRHPPGRHPPPQCMLGYTPPPAQCMLIYSQQAGGTHPTGMHSCYPRALERTMHYCASWSQTNKRLTVKPLNSVADLGGARLSCPLSVQFFSFSCSFQQIFFEIIGSAPSGKSWIRHLNCIVKSKISYWALLSHTVYDL